MNTKLKNYAFILVYSWTICLACAQELSQLKLPPGVPREVDTNGNVVFINYKFTTKEYNAYAFDWMIREANHVAASLNIEEALPIRSANLIGTVVFPFGYGTLRQSVGTITTSNYWYSFSAGWKFNHISIQNLDRICSDYRFRPELPDSELDTNAVYRMAVGWLTALSIDVGKLNQTCRLVIEPSRYWNGINVRGKINKTKWVPIFEVMWVGTQYDGSIGSTAYVQLYAPDKRLLALWVNNAAYIKRASLPLTNLASLFPGSAEIKTNYSAGGYLR